MPDIADEAQANEEAYRAAALAALRLPVNTGRRVCLDCDTPIPEKRRAALPGAFRCIDCQEAAERGLG